MLEELPFKCMQSLNPDIWIYHLTAIAKYDGCETFERHDCSADTMIHLGVQAETRKLLQTETLLQVLWTTLQTTVDKEVGDTQCVWLASGLDLSRTRRRFVTTCSDLSDSKLRFVAAFTSCLSLLTDSLVVRCHYEQVVLAKYTHNTHVCYSVCRAGISFPGDIWIWIFCKVWTSCRVVVGKIGHPRNLSNSIPPTSIQTCQRKSQCSQKTGINSAGWNLKMNEGKRRRG